MVKVQGTHGPVQVQIIGVLDTIVYLRKKEIEIATNAGLGLVKAAVLVGQEVQESIIGNRDEPKSVDTGKFGNSISVKKVGKFVLEVYPKNVDYAAALEYGTSRGINGRHHFQNTRKRVEGEAIKVFEKEMKKK